MKNKIKFSVIVPIYSVERYLEECILSVKKQTYTGWELLLVVDGSPDNSIDICRKYESEQIRVFLRENAGVSAARNFGIENSRGEYLLFLDGDDMLRENTLEVLCFYALDYDVVGFCWSSFYANGTLKRAAAPLGDRFVFENKTKIFDTILYENSLGSACLLSVKRSLLNDVEATRFRQRMIFLEDQIFCNQIFEKARNGILLGDDLYLYRIRASGAVRSYKEQKIEDADVLLSYLQDRADVWGVNLDEARFSRRFYNFVLAEAMIAVPLERSAGFVAMSKLAESKMIQHLAKYKSCFSLYKRMILTAIEKRKFKRLRRLIKWREFIAKMAGKRKHNKHCYR